MLLELIGRYLVPVTFVQSQLMALFLLIRRQGSKRQNRVLAAFLFAFGIVIGSRFLLSHRDLLQNRTLFRIGSDFRFFIGPLFYLYLRSVFKPSRRLKARDLWHSGLFVFVVLNQSAGPSILSHTWKVYIYLDVAQFLVYFSWSVVEFKLVSLFRKTDCFRFDPRFSLWLRFFILSNLAAFLFLVFFMLFVDKVIDMPQWDSWFARVAAFSNFVFIHAVVFAALIFPDMFVSIRYRNAELPEAIRRKYLARLNRLMDAEKPYLDPSLSLNSLAGRLSISSKHLSQVINRSFQRNFYHWINSYRVEECKRRLLDERDSQSNILRIAFESGFNSKNTFNTAFKHATGMTPSEFKKRSPSTS